jgi:hypothetical protein
MLAQVPELEAQPDQPPGRLRDHHLAGRRQRLQSRRQVGGLADHRLLLRRPLADEVANHHETGGNAHPATERSAAALQPGHGRGDRYTRPDCPLGVVLVRSWPAEVSEHAIAHELGDILRSA